LKYNQPLIERLRYRWRSPYMQWFNVHNSLLIAHIRLEIINGQAGYPQTMPDHTSVGRVIHNFGKLLTNVMNFIDTEIGKF
jgi:hypothetical protein